METPNENASNLLPQWQPGQSGNPSGRPKKKPLTKDLRAALEQTVGKSTKTTRQALIERLLGIALHGKRSESLSAMKLIFAYSDGLPVQEVEVDVYAAARRLAEKSGADPDWLVNRAREIAEEAARVE